MIRVSFMMAALVAVAACRGAHSDAPSLTQTESAQTPDELALTCADGALLTEGDYLAQNNTWGKDTLIGWSQCVGIGRGPGNSVTARFTWDWLNSGTHVKAYPELIFGYKPGSASTTPLLPRRINTIQKLRVSYDVSLFYTGSGNIAFDIWLTDTDRPATFAVPPITHEIMVWLGSYGSISPGGTLVERATIDGVAYDVFVGDNFGSGWRYIAYQSVDGDRNVDTLDVLSLLTHAQQENLITGSEYLSSLEFGAEVVSGTGDMKINAYAVRLE